MPIALCALLSLAVVAVAAAEVPRPTAGGDHSWMAYAAFRALSAEDQAWYGPEIAPFISTYTHLPDCNWNNYGEFGGWSGLPDEPRTPDTRREWELSEFTGNNANTGAGRRFGHDPAGLYAAVPWYLPRLLERLRGAAAEQPPDQFMQALIQLGCFSHLVQDCGTFPATQALHRSAHFDLTRISLDGYTPRELSREANALEGVVLGRAKALVACCDEQAPALRAAQQAGDAAAETRIRAACCNEACKLLADLYHTLACLVGPAPRPAAPELGRNLVLNPEVEEEDPGERLPRHWVVGYGDLTDRVGRALWEGQISRNARLAHSGRHSLKLMWTPGKGLEWRQTWPSAVRVREGEYYAAAAWTMVYGGTGSTAVVLGFYRDDLSPVEESASATVTGRTDWQRLRVAARVPPGATRARIILRSAGNEGATWFDDIELSRTDAATCERLRSAAPETDRLVLHCPFSSDLGDHSLFAGLNSPIAGLSGTQPASLLADSPGRGRALTLDGRDDFVEVPHSYVQDVLSPPGAMTLVLWLRTTRPGPAFICGKVSGGAPPRGYRLDLTAHGSVRFSVAVEGTLEPAAEAPLPLQAGVLSEWTQIAAVRDGEGGLCVYVNGAPGPRVVRAGAWQPSPASLYLGAEHGVTGFLAGSISDLRLYREALSPQEIAALR